LYDTIVVRCLADWKNTVFLSTPAETVSP
jgi:hypothetical protein